MIEQPPLSKNKSLTIRLLRVLRYNKARTERALMLMPAEQKPLFYVLPFLLHVNHPELPGYIEGDDIPFGIHNYSFRHVVEQALFQCFPEKRELLSDIKPLWPRQRAIDSLVLMGSIGSIAQTDTSDFDYWVCVDGNKMSTTALQSLQEKLTAIELWAEATFTIEVHFFLSEIDNVRRNDFGIADGESSGSAQALFLKAEFYATNIVVAGKAPFWWLTPEKCNEQQYHGLQKNLEDGGSPDPRWFMDLGNIERLDANELFGATIWQLSKAMDSPFKSLLKIAKLEVYLAEIDDGQPLCNLLKKHVHRGAKALSKVPAVDPYALMFDQLIMHYENNGQPEDVLLLQQCLYLKCDCKLSLPIEPDRSSTFKRQIISAYVIKWGWTKKDLAYLDNQQVWTLKERIELSQRIHKFLLNCYRRISTQISPEQQKMNRQDMTVIGRRLSTFYAKKLNKIKFLRRAFDENLHCDTVTVSVKRNKAGLETWSAFAGDQLSRTGKVDQSQKITQSRSAIELIAWCVASRIIDASTKVLLDYHAGDMSELDLSDLLKHVCRYFPPIKVSSLPRADLLSPQRVTTCFALVNFQTARQKASVEEVSVLYNTSWGETFLLHGKDALDKLWFEIQSASPTPSCYVLVPRGHQQSRIQGEFLESTDIEFSLLY
ncbi:class I adenylate cyclase [Alteromonas sp. 1_MG-2023]|uniref:class I adenylate cyclase n=1 Tax=Alteromonas sp. 1_MG-2023 TaxID=3062669 RepID=UPI0026E211F0|nr:class I adenylate cyclase [Alteromonas sp. 1_MG-2023]MDO6566431.1 class I adenylate cyclase [Alteromonas sp. 1_MG-2023]